VSVLQAPDVEYNEGEWRRFAECRSLDPEVFFPIGANGLATDYIDTAKNICSVCIVKEPCLEYALASNQDCGIWGGLTEDERRAVRRGRRVSA
jgi:WhiB family redox-sensing transcriptional regulator